MTQILAAFPGCGKSTFYMNNKDICTDSDSSTFDKKHFPNNYVKYIEKLYKASELKYIFISTHKEVLQELTKRNIPFTVIIPNPKRLEEFKTNYINRGSSDILIDKIVDNWDDWLNNILTTYTNVITLEDNEYISTHFQKHILTRKENLWN